MHLIAQRSQQERLEPMHLLSHVSGDKLLELHDLITKSDLESKPVSLLRELIYALLLVSADDVGRNGVMEGTRLNCKGTLSNSIFEQSLAQYVRFLWQYRGRVDGEFISRFWRRLSTQLDQRSATAELQLAEDLLLGRTPLGPVISVKGIPESKVTGERVPEYCAQTIDGVRLVESKAIGKPNQTLLRNGVRVNAGDANGQLRAYAERMGEVEGCLIRLDGRDTGRTPETPEKIAEWVSGKLPSPRELNVTRWVEVFYRNGGGELVRVVLELYERRFVLRSSELML